MTVSSLSWRKVLPTLLSSSFEAVTPNFHSIFLSVDIRPGCTKNASAKEVLLTESDEAHTADGRLNSRIREWRDVTIGSGLLAGVSERRQTRRAPRVKSGSPGDANCRPASAPPLAGGS